MAFHLRYVKKLILFLSGVLVVFVIQRAFSQLLFKLDRLVDEVRNSNKQDIDNLNIRSYCAIDKNFDSNNVLFVETNSSRERLTFQESCAVESAARHNPELNVQLFSVNAKVDDVILNAYPNVVLKLTSLQALFKNTLLEEWWTSGRLSKQSYFRESHTSDALRFLLSYTYGGFYSDLDTITIKNLAPLRKYAGVGVQRYSNYEISSGFMHFPKQHPFMLYILKRFPDQYNASSWGANGPIMIHNNLHSYCKITDRGQLMIKKLDFYKKGFKNTVCDVSLYPSEFMYPILAEHSPKLFEHDATIKISQFIHTYQVHFYGKETNKVAKIDKFESSVYEFFASMNCPLSYRTYLGE